MRAPYQTLIILYKQEKNNFLYGIFYRQKEKFWQFISGGGEDGEQPEDTAIRELNEETQIKIEKDKLEKLDSISSIPVINVTGEYTWGKNVFVIPEYTFAVNIENKTIKLSNEHKLMNWMTYEEAVTKLKYDSNKTALWELNEKLKRRK